MRIVLDVNILVRANNRTAGLARDLLRELLRQRWTILISGEMLVELARVLRYPRLQLRYNLNEADLYDYIQFLRQAVELVAPDVALLSPPPVKATALAAFVHCAYFPNPCTMVHK